MSGFELLLGLVCVTAGAAVQSTIGFGAALVSVPLLLLLDPRLVPGPVTVAGDAEASGAETPSRSSTSSGMSSSNRTCSFASLRMRIVPESTGEATSSTTSRIADGYTFIAL